MIKELGTLGFFIRFNTSASAGIRMVEIFSSSTATTSLFTASTNSSRTINFSQSSSCYVDGFYSTSVKDSQWQHVSFTFNPKLQTYSENNFLIRFGENDAVDFNIQNMYALDALLSPLEIRNMHYTFTSSSPTISSGELPTSSSASMEFIDKIENIHSSSLTKTVYQPYKSQKKFFGDVNYADFSIIQDNATNSPPFQPTALTGSSRFVDGILIKSGDRIMTRHAVYEVGSVGALTRVTVASGQYINIIGGMQYSGTTWLKTATTFENLPILNKVNHYLDISGR